MSSRIDAAALDRAAALKRGVRQRLATIGVRLTLWSTGTTLFVCLVLCGALYIGMRYSLLLEVDAFLHAELEELGAKVKANLHDLGEAEAEIRREIGHRPTRDLSFRVLDTSGRIVVSSELDDVSAGVTAVQGDLDPGLTRDHFQTLRLPRGDVRYRVCTEPLFEDETSDLVAQVWYSLKSVDHSLALLRRISGIALATATLVALVASWLLVRRGLRTVDSMTVTARSIDSNRLADRLPRSGTGDELDRLAETLNDMLDRIEQHVARMRRFTADASHEMRSPLAALRGLAEVALTRQRTADELREVLEASVEQYDRLQHLAEDLLLLARADADEALLRLDPVVLGDVIRDAAELYGPLAEEAGFALAVGPLPEVLVRGDGGRLRQMVGNLIDNAIKHGRRAGRIDVTLERCDGVAVMTVRDEGDGIDPEDLPRVFDRFYRADRARSTEGAGLGLSICRWIARAHGGAIELASAPGEGTTACVSLPTGGPGAAS